MLPTKPETFMVSCCICGKSVPLQERKTDDQGRPVHENCDAAVVLGETTRTSGITSVSTTPKEELFPRLIADSNNLLFCSLCGCRFSADVRPSMSVAFAKHLMNGHKPA
jgi:transcription elongation factor Elf1